MSYLDWELAAYQDYQERYCGICGEYSDDDWQCDCKEEDEEEEDEIHLGI
jgi:hypothetical protein